MRSHGGPHGHWDKDRLTMTDPSERKFMSSPLDREFGPDELSPYAPKWARAAGDATRRATAPKQEAGFRVDEAERSTSRFDGGPAIDNYPVPRSLEPNLIPQAYAVRS